MIYDAVLSFGTYHFHPEGIIISERRPWDFTQLKIQRCYRELRMNDKRGVPDEGSAFFHIVREPENR